MERQSQYRYWPHLIPFYIIKCVRGGVIQSNNKADLQSESILIICRRYKDGAGLDIQSQIMRDDLWCKPFSCSFFNSKHS